MPDTSMNAWKPYHPSAEAPWDLARVVHLHRRAAFGAPWDVLQQDLSAGPQAAVDRLLAGGYQDQSPGGFESLSSSIGAAAAASGSPGRLKAWWMLRMLMSPDPLGERLTLMWHNHFATSNRKVQDLAMMRDQNEVLRRHARAPFGELLSAAVKHPAMLVWLDADSNRKGRPNENLARELLELFTLGAGHYEEDDVRHAARALTGWTVVSGKFGYRDARHDPAELEFLGERSPLTGDELLERLLAHPATARRLAWRICGGLLGESVADEQAIDELAAGLEQNQLSIGWAIEQVVRSELFFSTANLRSRVAGPAEFIVGALRSLERTSPPPSTLLLAEWSTRMGQDLFYPPNVGGWGEGRSWLTTQALIARANFGHAVAAGALWRTAAPPPVNPLLRRHDAPRGLEGRIAWLAKLLWGVAPEKVVESIAKQAAAASRADPLPTALGLLLGHPENCLA